MAAAKNAKLGPLAERGVGELAYVYDMGDGWEHTVRVEAVEAADPGTHYPRLVAGARRCPPEDVGGIPGFEYFLEVMADPGHEEHAERLEWYGGPFDADDMDELVAKRRLGVMAGRRAAGKAAYAKRRAPQG